MDFGFTEEQLIMQQTVKRFCEKELHYEHVKWMDENVDFPPDDLWQKFADLGMFSAACWLNTGGRAWG